MNSLNADCEVNVWSCLESTRGLTAVAARWRERLGPQFEPFKTAFLQRADGVAKGMPCPRGCACTHEIVIEQSPSTRTPPPGPLPIGWGEGEDSQGAGSWVQTAKSTFGEITPNPIRSGARDEGQPSTIRAVCRCDPPNCPDIPLAADEIVLLELSWNKLARALCRVFGLDYKPVELGLLNTRQIGSWGAEAVPVILTIQHERAWFRTVLLELIARLRRKFILFAPTTHHLDAVASELLASADAAFFALDANLILTSEGNLRLSSARAPGELFARFTPQPEDEEQDIADRAFALIQQLEYKEARKRPSVVTVFRMYCVDGLGMPVIARRCNCTRTTVKQRLKLIEAKTGMKPDQLRKLSAHFEKAESTLNDSRAAHIHRKNLIYDEDDSNES
jgi:hypothetical protein